jgi:zinc and cadmium transporter
MKKHPPFNCKKAGSAYYVCMFLDALLAGISVSLISLVGVFFFGRKSSEKNIEHFIIPIAVGIFLSLIFYELLPETILSAPVYGGITIAFGFIGFYVLSLVLHNHFHKKEKGKCGKKGSAILLLIGDGIHNISDGIVLATAFLINPTLGIFATIGIILHEIPQEITEYGVLLRAGYSRMHAAFYNFLSACSIIVGILLVFFLTEHTIIPLWIITGIAAGNLLYLAASDLLPKIHTKNTEKKSILQSAGLILLSFLCMTFLLNFIHSSSFGHTHTHTHTEGHIH